MKRLMSGKKKYTIGFQIITTDLGYLSTLWHGAADSAEENDVNLILFRGRELKHPTGNESQYNVIYQFINEQNIDALIMISTLLSNFINQDEFQSFLNSIKPLPVINIGKRLPGIPSIILDNKTGIHELGRHLIEVHRYKKIAFVKGLDRNDEARERFEAYQEILREHNLAFDPDLVVPGDFTWACAQSAMEELFRKKHGKIDAIMFANDEMAVASFGYLKKHGYEIPYNIAVTGFDDIDEAEFEHPPITTVRQPVYEQTKKALVMAIELLEGKEVPELTVMKTNTIIRSSCGCLSRTVNQFNLISEAVINEEKQGENSARPSCDIIIKDIKTLTGLNPDMPDSFFNNIREVYSGLIQYTEYCIKKEDLKSHSIKFMSILSRVLINELENNRDILIWQLIIKVMMEKLAASKKELKNILYEDIFPQVFGIIGEMSKLNQGNLRVKYFRQYLILRDFLYGITSLLSIEELLDYIARHLPRLGINTCIITQYEKEWRHALNEKWEIPEKQKVILYFDNSGKKKLQGAISKPFSSPRFLPKDILPNNKRISLIATPLFINETHFGNSFIEIAPLQGFFYESINSQISICYNTSLLYKKRETAEINLKIALSDLEKYNFQLNQLSLTDELTGLYNRRGFMSLAQNNLSLAQRMGKHGVIIFTDLDGLKTINDTYGHDAGDWAIKEISIILKKSFRSTDIIARMGGDEFTIFMVDSSMAQLGLYQKRIEKLLIDCNRNSHKPYKISISIGSIPFQPDNKTTIENLLKEADKILYIQKKKRKERPDFHPI